MTVLDIIPPVLSAPTVGVFKILLVAVLAVKTALLYFDDANLHIFFGKCDVSDFFFLGGGSSFFLRRGGRTEDTEARKLIVGIGYRRIYLRLFKEL